ncbi:hypothetical protein [Streptomyces sp. NPDC059918]|uniref:hypothetical protein n=1 Tax=unclassified Streptomyces TaxID=2593676 RepID=UPI003646D669
MPRKGCRARAAARPETVSGLDRDRLLREGAQPAVATAEFRAWVREVGAEAGAQPATPTTPSTTPSSRRN